MNRRQLITAASAAAVTSLGGLTLPRSARAGTKAKNLIMVFVSGGWDVTMSFAPQLDNPNVDGPRVDENPNIQDDREYLAQYGDITVALNDFKRPSAKVFFDAWADRCCIVNGVFTGAVGHETSTIRMLTGTESNRNPDLCAIVGHHYADDLPLGYVNLAGPPFVGPYAASSGRVGFNSQLRLLFDGSQPYPTPAAFPFQYPLNVLSNEEHVDVTAFLQGRAAKWRTERGASPQLADLDESWDRAARFREKASDLVGTLTLGSEPTFQEQAVLASELLDRGACRTLMMDSRAAWDTHTGNEAQHTNYLALFVNLDALMKTLTDSGLLDSTLVVVVSEMTRTPKINANGGKDHWPHASVMMLGAGVKPRGSVGGYSSSLESLPVDLASGAVSSGGELLRYPNLSAGILEHLDMDPAEFFPEAEPFRGFVDG